MESQPLKSADKGFLIWSSLTFVMPGMNGIELAIAVSQQFRDCHILLFSGQADTAAILEDAKRQSYDFELLAKSLHPEELVTKIKDLIGPPDARRRLFSTLQASGGEDVGITHVTSRQETTISHVTFVH